MFVFSALTFIVALYYVEQQVRLRTLNYEIIELKKQRKQLIEQQQSRIARLKRIRDELKQHTVKLQESLQAKNTQLAQTRKKLEQFITDPADEDQPNQQSEPFDLQRLEGLAELAKRLSKPPEENQAE